MTSFLGTPATAPGPLGPQMLRHTRQIRKDPLGFLAEMRRQYGDVVQFPIPWPPSYLVASSDATHQVLVGRPGGYDKGTIQYRSLSLVTGNGLLVAPDADWRRQRPVVQPAFHHSFLPAVATVVREECDRLVADWRRTPRGGLVDVDAAMLELTLRVVGRCLFGDDLRGRTAELADATLEALQVVIQRSRVPIAVPQSWPTPANRRLARSLAALDAAVATLVANRAATGTAGSGGELLLDHLMAAPGWSPQQVRDQVVTFLVAGHETAASALGWALWLLAGSPSEQQRIVDIGDDHARACADEALRLYPPAWVISRRAERVDVIAGHDIPVGALVITSPYLIHRDERYWPQPDQFRPDRFTGRLTPQQRRAYLPFGAGLRLCIGREFARWEMTTVLTQLMTAFRLSRATDHPGVLPSVTLRPARGMIVRLHPR